MEKEVIYGQILSKKNHYRLGTDKDGSNPRIVKDQAFRKYEQSFLNQCSIYKNRYISESFTLYLAVYNRTNRFDIDGAITTALDCLQMANAIKDDNLCTKVLTEKRLSPNPRIEFAIEPNQPSLFDD